MIDFEQRFNDYRAYINEKLAAYVATDGSKICDSMNYSVMAGGKRIRPFLRSNAAAFAAVITKRRLPLRARLK